MAIRTFKEIIDNKAFRISSKDRQIFEQGNLQSFFGFSNSDMIEFILYDINDNQLPQGEFGELVRYIPLSSESIRDYFLVADGTLFQQFNFPSEYFIDVERLCKEAGYSNGIFKTQITLLNKRVGYESPNEKLWIQEISPSRTELKLLPLRNETADKTDLLQRFRIMVDGSDFRDDVVASVGTFIESINPSEVSGFIKKIYGDKWYNTLVREFGIRGLDNLATTIYNKFVEAMKYEFSNRVSYIDDPNYGKPKSISTSLKLDKTDVFKIAQRILVECVQKYLPQRTIQAKSEFDTTFDASRDNTGTILKRRQTDVVIQPKPAVVTVTKKKTEPIKTVSFDREIDKELPIEIPKPIFKEPNPVRVTKPKEQPPVITPKLPIMSDKILLGEDVPVFSGGGGSGFNQIIETDVISGRNAVIDRPSLLLTRQNQK
jgi:hypothetical protein